MTDGTGPDEHDDAPSKVPVTDDATGSGAADGESPSSDGADAVADESGTVDAERDVAAEEAGLVEAEQDDAADDQGVVEAQQDEAAGEPGSVEAEEPTASEVIDEQVTTAPDEVTDAPGPSGRDGDDRAVAPTEAVETATVAPEAAAPDAAQPPSEESGTAMPSPDVPGTAASAPEVSAPQAPVEEVSPAPRDDPADAGVPVTEPARPEADATGWAPLVAARRARELEEPGDPGSVPDGATAVLPPVTAAPSTAAPVTATSSDAVPSAAAAAPATPVPPAAPAAPAAPSTSVPSAEPAAPVVAAASPLAAALPTGPATPATPAVGAPSTAPTGSPLDVFEEQEPRPRRWLRRVLVPVGVLVVLGGVYVGASYAVADKVPRGATVAGVDIGGLTSQAAVDRLTQELADTSTEPVPVVANDVQAQVDPAAAGLTFDAQATVDGLTGVDLAQPVRLWQHLVGVGAQEPVTHVDADALKESIQSLTTSLALAPVDGAIVFADGAPHATDAVDGWAVDVDAAAQTVQEGWLVDERPLSLPTVVVEPAVTQEATEAALVSARDVTSAPVGVTVADRLATLSPEVLAAAATYAPQDGELVLTMDGPTLVQSVLEQLPDLLTEAADAHFEFQNDAPVIVPGTPGTTLDPQAVATAVADAVHASVRTAAVELVESDPAESTAELEALGITEIVSEFSTPLTSEPRRTTNIANGASKISGTLVRPDETFSLTEALGPIDAEHGFVEAGAIVSGEHVDAWGGGLSQISTTTYNAAYFAGFEDIEHKPHSEWFSRYPEGREATLFTGTLDMQWKNNTPYGALVQAWVADGRVYVRIWGTKYWTVESETSGRSGVVAPTTVYSQSPTCEPSSAGNPGFTVTVTRKRYLNGVLDATESNTWRYKPQNKVVCGPAPTEPAATP